MKLALTCSPFFFHPVSRGTCGRRRCFLTKRTSPLIDATARWYVSSFSSGIGGRLVSSIGIFSPFVFEFCQSKSSTWTCTVMGSMLGVLIRRSLNIAAKTGSKISLLMRQCHRSFAARAKPSRLVTKPSMPPNWFKRDWMDGFCHHSLPTPANLDIAIGRLLNRAKMMLQASHLINGWLQHFVKQKANRMPTALVFKIRLSIPQIPSLCSVDRATAHGFQNQ